MKIRIMSVGHKMPRWVSDGCEEYIRRMPREARVELVEIKPEKRGSGKTTQQVQEAERDRINAALSRNELRVVLDERGVVHTTQDLADHMQNWMGAGHDVACIIGGADGLHDDLKKDAHLLLTLSRFTLPHGLVRVVLAEQLYRAMTLIQGHPYHRE